MAVLIRMHSSRRSYPFSGPSPVDYILLGIVFFKDINAEFIGIRKSCI